MADKLSTRRAEGAAVVGDGERVSVSENGNVLETDRGTTTVSERVVTVISGLAAQQVEGLQMGAGGR